MMTTSLRAQHWAAILRAHAELATAALIVASEAMLRGGAVL